MKLTTTHRGESLAATHHGLQLEAVAVLTPGATTCTNSTCTTCAATQITP